MALSDDDKKKLAEGLSTFSEDELAEIKGKLETLHGELMDANSQFPETRKFLAGRGLTHVKQLDRQGIKDLTAHLQTVLARITN
jgi:hypothetical protein